MLNYNYINFIIDARQSIPKAEKEACKPPTLYKNAPKYRSKSGSVSSLNSNCSDSSNKSYITQSKLFFAFCRFKAPFS